MVVDLSSTLGRKSLVNPPVAITAEHRLDGFDCGVPSLDDWLLRRALRNQANGASRTFVSCEVGREYSRVVGYYALAASAVAVDAAPGRFKRNMPDPIPVVVLGRLAVARPNHGKGLGRALFQDAARRIIRTAETVGIRGMLVHAISDEAKAFYEQLGLTASPLDPMVLMATVADLTEAARI
ncbi:MAG: GNAT family N-acetyltransferase [Variovorax sp.]